MLFSKKWIALLSLVPASSFAMFCPNNFNQINMGDTPDQVKLQCGKPDTEKESESTAKQPQEWNYYVKMSASDSATLKTSIAFNQGLVTNMSVNGIGVSSTAICGGNTVKVGDTQESVTRSCGKPAFINQGTQTIPPTKVVELTYGNKVLVFESGVLTQLK